MPVAVRGVDLLATHNFCSDGRACAALFHYAGLPLEQIYFLSAGMSFQQDFLDICKGRHVMLADISPATRRDLHKLWAVAASVRVLDHHASAMDKFRYYDGFKFRDDVSGCMMVYGAY
jgi:hypothetical protein